MRVMHIALLVAVLIPACAVAGTPAETQAELSLPDVHGQTKSLADFHGKVVVVNFWATWCGPCKHEMPLFVDAAKHYGEDRVQIVAVSLDDETTRSKIPSFVEKQKMSFPILLGNTEAMQQLGLGEAVPATAFVDQDGRVVARILGEVSKSELKDRIEWLLKDKAGKHPPELVNNLNKKQDEGMMPVMH
jgi:thiol-disulfide isomerase/thioredoxin